MHDHRFVLTLSCPDRTGIVARITTFLADIGGWITEAAYHSDDESGRFFTRQEIRADSVPFGVDELRARFGVVAGRTGGRQLAGHRQRRPEDRRAAGLQGGPLPVRAAGPLALQGDAPPTSAW